MGIRSVLDSTLGSEDWTLHVRCTCRYIFFSGERLDRESRAFWTVQTQGIYVENIFNFVFA